MEKTSHYIEFLMRVSWTKITESPVLFNSLRNLHRKFSFWDYVTSKSILLFPTEKISSCVPHFFICIGSRAISARENRFMFVCCTSKYERRKWHIESSGLPHETLVWIKPDENNMFGSDSFVDCNSFKEFTLDELKLKYQAGQLKYIGEVRDVHFEQLLIGLEKSPCIISTIKEVVAVVKKTVFV